MKILKKHYFDFTPHLNGHGEGLTLVTTFYDNGGGPSDPFIDQDLTLLSHRNAIRIHLTDILTPSSLRELADQLEAIQQSLPKKSGKNKK